MDECGICGGAGITQGYCDCDGNQLDALGVCGGPCEADVDANGIVMRTKSSVAPTLQPATTVLTQVWMMVVVRFRTIKIVKDFA